MSCALIQNTSLQNRTTLHFTFHGMLRFLPDETIFVLINRWHEDSQQFSFIFKIQTHSNNAS